MPAYSKTTALLLALLALAGCAGPAYYVQATAGHLELMRQRQPVADLVARADTDPELATRLRTATAARNFAIETLGLPETDSYTRFVRTGRDAVTWNVVVAPEFSLEPRTWCFPVAGCVPYRGYFDPADAERFAAAQRRRGYDVTVSPALAYSTLGWFDDPLLDTMLRYSDDQLAATLFHEMAHARLWVRGDAAFNEAFAGFVEARGLERWLQAVGAASRANAWQRRREAARDFQRLLDTTRAALETVYRGEATDDAKRRRKQDAFAALHADYRTLVRERWNGDDFFSGWFDGGLNNARLALAHTYAGGQCSFARLWAEADADFARFYRLAESRASLDEADRRAWLDQPCPAIASTGDL